MRRSILYLDDDASHLELFSELFGAEYDLRTTPSLAEARRMLVEHAPDIIISDQVMPEMMGTEFLREAARLSPASARVLLTGARTVGEVLSEVSAGIVQLFLPKPWTEEEMRAALARAAHLSAPPKTRRPRRKGKRDQG